MSHADPTQAPPDIERSIRWLSRDVRRAMHDDPDRVHDRARRRLSDLVGHSKDHSPFFADLYAGVAPTTELVELPTTGKDMLMAAFDDWSTDRRITLEAARQFSARDGAVGDRFLGRYLYSETSGTTSSTGRFVTEDAALRVLHALRSRIPRPPARTVAHIARKRGRSAAIINVAGHHLGSAYYRHLSGEPRRGRSVLSVTDPLSVIGERLSQLDPATVSSYGSVLTLLAEQQLAGAVDVDPALLLPFSETVTAAARRRLHEAWPRAVVLERYVANECMFVSARCAHGSHHLNADWVILEPVDTEGRPVPPGVESHTVLLTTLFRRVQPVIRYDLGDRVRSLPHACPCGNRLPAFDVLGRTGDLVTFRSPRGRRSISPTVVTVMLDEIEGIVASQLLIHADDHVGVLLTAHHDADPVRAMDTARAVVRAAFHGAEITSVTVDAEIGPPVREPGGKMKRVLDLRVV